MNIFNRKLESEKEHYSDYDINFNLKWNRDIADRKNAQAVSQSLINIVTTTKGSMPFMPDYGTTLGSDLFKNITPFLLTTTEEDIVSSIRRYEPRVEHLNVTIIPSMGNKNTIEVTIEFTTKYDLNNKNQLSFELEY